MRTSVVFKTVTILALNNSLTLAKNLISCSWGDFSTRPLLTTASVKHIAKYDNGTVTQANEVLLSITPIQFDQMSQYLFLILAPQYQDERWTPEQFPSISAASAGNHKQISSRWKRCRTPYLSGPWSETEFNSFHLNWLKDFLDFLLWRFLALKIFSVAQCKT